MQQILVVDDEIGIRELLSEILRDEGYQVRLAENASQARTLRTQARPDLVLLDIWMPDTDGITLLKEWASSGLLTMPVVMMSGHGTIDTAVEATRIGAYDFLEKPIALQKLLATVGRALRSGEQQVKPTLMLATLGPRCSSNRAQAAPRARRQSQVAAVVDGRARLRRRAVREIPASSERAVGGAGKYGGARRGAARSAAAGARRHAVSA
jgi:DNA-binding NtrC family response regulator